VREHLLRQPEVGDVDVPVAVDEHVRGLDVAMDVAGAVDGVQPDARLADLVGRATRRERAATPHERAHVVAVDEAHRDVRDAVPLSRGMHRNHVRMLDRRRRPRLPEEALADQPVLEQLGRDHLERDDPLELELAGPVDDAHPATADDRLDPITGDHSPGREEPQAHRCWYIRTGDAVPTG
jgi:hypothetical protein